MVALAALVGPDGAGKTTLIRLIAGLMRPDAGTLIVDGIDVTREPQQVQDRIAYMPQRFGLYEDLSVQENLDLYASLHGISRQERNRRYPELLQMTDLARFTQRLAGNLSGGMKQKLGLACTLIGSPEVLLLDEPTVGVDPLSRRELWEIIARLVREQSLTVLMSTSYLDEAERCDRVFVLREGKLLASGPPQEVTAIAEGHSFEADPPAGEPARNLQSRLLDDPAIIDAVPEAGRVHFVDADVERGARSIAEGIACRCRGGAVRGRFHVAAAPAKQRETAAVRVAVGRPQRRDRCRRERDRGARPGPQVRQLHRRQSHQFRSPSRRDLRPARSERRGQDNDLSHVVRASVGDFGDAARRRASTCGARVPPRGNTSAMWHRNSRSMASSRSPRISISSPAPTGCAARVSANALPGRSPSSSSSR